MTRVYVLDRDTLDVLGLIDQSFTALTYTRRFQAMDTVLLSINRKRLYADQIEKGRLLFLPDEGDRVFLIEQIETLQSGDQSKDLMKVTGRSLEGIAMAERLCIPPTGQSHDALDSVAAETAIKHYVDVNAVDAEDPDRNVPGLVIAADAAMGVIVSTAARYHVLLDFVIDIGLLSGLGWEIVLDKTEGEFVFDIITGTDRSASVFFDFDFETLEQWDELDSALDSKSVVVVAGQGEGTDREIVTRPPSGSGDPPLPSGFDRREVFIDARDIDAGETELLEARGDATLAALGDEIALEATVHQFGSFRYREHWDLGDIVLVRDVTRDLAYSARVVEVEVTIEDTAAAPTVVATLGRAFPTIRSRVSGGSGGTADGGGVSSGPPSGPAGGVLSGTYPDPGFAVDMVTEAELTTHTALPNAHHNRAHDHSNASDTTALAPVTVAISSTGSSALTIGGDCALYRAAADILQTDDAFRSRRAATTDEAFATHESASSTLRFQITAEGRHDWGPTSGSMDISLHRSAAGVMKLGLPTGSGPGRLYIGDSDTGADLVDTELYLGIERPWRFYQVGTGASAQLALAPVVADKSFVIQSTDGTTRFAFHARDGSDASRLTIPTGSVIGGWATAFPTTVNSGDLFFRTDLNMLFQYNGTRWVSVELYQHQFGVGWSNLAATDSNGVDRTRTLAPQLRGGSDIWIEDFVLVFNVSGGTALSGSHKWAVTLALLTAAGGATTRATNTINSGASSVWRTSTTVVDALMNNGTTHWFAYSTATKTGTPGGLYCYHGFTYRVVAT